MRTREQAINDLRTELAEERREQLVETLFEDARSVLAHDWTDDNPALRYARERVGKRFAATLDRFLGKPRPR